MHYEESHPPTVVLFHSTDKLQNATHGIVKMMEFWGEAITVRAMAPSEAHITTYLATSHLNPSNGGRDPLTPPQQTPPTGGTLCHLQAELGDLAPAHERPHIGNCTMQNTCAPSNPPPNEWVCPMGSREPEEDDQEVTFPGGGRWGPPRQPTPSTEPEQLVGGRVPSGPPP